MTLKQTCRRLRERGFVAAWNGAPALGALFCTGPHAGSFLHSQLTSDVLDLGHGEGQLSARVDRKGRILAWFSLHRLPDRGQAHSLYLLLLPREEAGILREDLLSSVVSEDVLIDDVSDDLVGVLHEGPQVVSGCAYSATNADTGAPHGAWRIDRSFTGDPGTLLLWFGDVEEQLTVLAGLRGDAVALDVEPFAEQAWRSLLTEAGRPVMGRDLAPGTRVLNQTGLTDDTVSWTKGCFLGQEILARVKTYGSPPESLRTLVFPNRDEVSTPAPGTEICTPDGDVVGTWGGSGWSTTREAHAALAFLKRRHGVPGRNMVVGLEDGSIEAEVTLAPLYDAVDHEARGRRFYERAVESFGAGDDQGAVDLLEQALLLLPEHADALEALGVILGRLERYDEAVAVFERLEVVAPGEPMVHVNLSLFHMKLGDKEEAERQKTLATLKRFGVAAAPDERPALESEARRKLAMFEEVLEFDPDDPLALMGAGDALALLGDVGAAELRLARANKGQPDNSALYLKRGRVLETLERFDEASDVYREGVTVAARRGDLQPLRDMEHRLLVLRARHHTPG